MTIAVMGAGAFGTALAITLSQDAPVTLWTRNPEHAAEMVADGQNGRRLAGHQFPKKLVVSSETTHLDTAQTVLVCVPMQKLRNFLTEHKSLLAEKMLVACCKGIELNTGKGPVDIIQDVCPSATAALLTGPSFAQDIAQGLPTALTLACADGDTAHKLQQDLSNSTLRLYRTTDVVGASLGGALKNVVAIASGAAIGAGLGESARAALMTRGNAEMQRLAAARGADPSTLAGLSGFGDLVLTCTSTLSRNYRFGLALGAGTTFDPDTTVEGAATAIAVAAEAHQSGLDLPISSAVAALVQNRLDVKDAMASLLSRSLKEE